MLLKEALDSFFSYCHHTNHLTIFSMEKNSENALGVVKAHNGKYKLH